LRDITGDLKERLSFVEEQGKAENVEYERDRKILDERHAAKIAELNTEWQSLQRALQAELRRLGKAIDETQPPAPTLSLDDFFVQTVERFGMATKTNLRDEARHAGYFAGGESGGRKTHVILLNIVRAGRIREVAPDTYAPAHKPGEFVLPLGALHS
jgi:hypothetical protein